jgi:hypothetical protein
LGSWHIDTVIIVIITRKITTTLEKNNFSWRNKDNKQLDTPESWDWMTEKKGERQGSGGWLSYPAKSAARAGSAVLTFLVCCPRGDWRLTWAEECGDGHWWT